MKEEDDGLSTDVLGHKFYSILFFYWMLLFGFHRLSYGDTNGAKTNIKGPLFVEQLKLNVVVEE